jgi:hypothetical protein
MSRTRTSRAIEALGSTTLALACAIAVWFAGAGTALAPEPSRTTSYLGTGSSSALWINANTSTTAYYLSSSNWTASSIPVGFPCTTVANVGSNYSLVKVIQGSGAYRRCV